MTAIGSPGPPASLTSALAATAVPGDSGRTSPGSQAPAARIAAPFEPREPDIGEDLRHLGPHLVPGPATVLEPERDIVLGAIHDQLAVGVLEDKPDATAGRRGRSGGPARDVRSVERQATLPLPG